jgi:hypothetical protein
VSTHTLAALPRFTTVRQVNLKNAQAPHNSHGGLVLTPWEATQVRQAYICMRMRRIRTLCLYARTRMRSCQCRQRTPCIMQFHRFMTHSCMHVSVYVRPSERIRMHHATLTVASMEFGSPVRRKQADPSASKDFAVHRVPAEELLGAGFRMTRLSTRYTYPPLSHGVWRSVTETSPQREGVLLGAQEAKQFAAGLGQPHPSCCGQGQGRGRPQSAYDNASQEGGQVQFLTLLVLQCARSSMHADPLSYPLMRALTHNVSHVSAPQRYHATVDCQLAVRFSASVRHRCAPTAKITRALLSYIHWHGNSLLLITIRLLMLVVAACVYAPSLSSPGRCRRHHYGNHPENGLTQAAPRRVHVSRPLQLS